MVGFCIFVKEIAYQFANGACDGSTFRLIKNPK